MSATHTHKSKQLSKWEQQELLTALRARVSVRKSYEQGQTVSKSMKRDLRKAAEAAGSLYEDFSQAREIHLIF